MIVAFTRSSTIFDDSRASKELFAFLEAGYKVIVFGWDRSGKAVVECTELFKEYKDSIRFKFYSGSTGESKISKIVSRMKWNKWLKSQLASLKHIDIIHACDYDTGCAVRKIANRMKIKYVYDIYDYYVDAHPVPAALKNIIENDETRIINDATATIICTEERKAQIKKASPQKLIVIHNSPEVEELTSCNIQYDYVYCGSLYGGRLIEEILSNYPDNCNLKFVFAGYGEYKGIAAELCSKYENFQYLGAIPYSEVIEAEKKSKVISAIYEPSKRNHQLCAPNKFYEALALGKPVIVCRGTGIDSVVKKYKIGLVIEYTADSFYSALETLLKNEDLCMEMGKRGRKLYDEKFKWSIMKNRLLETYCSILE